jgi:DNA-binding response OmpR family regulator
MARILVVNDTQELLEMFRMLLETEGYDVVLSGMPILKVSEIEQLKPDIIILDLIFGDQKTGWQMLQMLKMQRTTAHIPVIVCTAALREVQEQEGYLVGQGVRVVYKPFDIDDLLTMIERALTDHPKRTHTKEKPQCAPGS